MAKSQIVLWSAQAMGVPTIAKIAFTSEDRVREVIHNFNTDGFDPGRSTPRSPAEVHPSERQAIKRWRFPSAGPQPALLDLEPSKLAEFLVAEGVVDDISHEGLRVLLREEGVSFQVIKTWKQSNDPDSRPIKTGSSSSTPSPMAPAQPGETTPPS